jgi:hypothetical protein
MNRDLIDRYLHAVKFWLPKPQQQDILAELAEDLHSQVEEREASLGRPLAEPDVVALLRKRGSPMRVASGYLPEHRLVDPAMLPLYRLVLKVILLWVLAPIFLLVVLGPAFDSAHPGVALVAFLSQAVRAFFFVIGIVTTVFAIMDRYQAKWVDRWDPRKLPLIPPAQPPMEWYNDFSGFVFGIGAAVFWAVVFAQHNGFTLNSGVSLVLAPIWGHIYWIVIALTLARAFVDLYCFLRRAWTPLRSWLRLSLDALAILIGCVLLRITDWATVTGPSIAPADAAKFLSWVSLTIQVTLVCAILIKLYDAWRQLRLLWRARPSDLTPTLVSLP